MTCAPDTLATFAASPNHAAVWYLLRNIKYRILLIYFFLFLDSLSSLVAFGSFQEVLKPRALYEEAGKIKPHRVMRTSVCHFVSKDEFVDLLMLSLAFSLGKSTCE